MGLRNPCDAKTTSDLSPTLAPSRLSLISGSPDGCKMTTRLPKPRKPSEQLRRRNRPEEWTVLPAEGCDLPAPPWP
jgi:hypothetical protein